MDGDVLLWSALIAVLVVGAVTAILLRGRRERAERNRPPRDPRRLGQDDAVRPHEASDRASGRNAWMRGGDGG
ncbi:hypothetical protein ACQEU5_15300 [Marinactinospora thermotolerans]|uniref:Uncharacterized protein n=1 Tax=Marinactinospora thermotolerans DSM 45154 TaxID=1122192 RepID=A0A1T4T7P7_9ACTN|nr:hypothetical protein [Marinactinospora thermotolerans]SKA36522.1 hypothetical protein SAMN02745673_04596 [Marinactinospora thermotolerans DSM 45154]